MATEIFCASIHTLKLVLAEKNQLKCIDNTIITLLYNQVLNKIKIVVRISSRAVVIMMKI